MNENPQGPVLHRLDRSGGNGVAAPDVTEDRSVAGSVLVELQGGFEMNSIVAQVDISEDQIWAMVDLYEQWAREEHRKFDRDFFLQNIAGRLEGGSLVPILLLDGETLIGCCMGTIFLELFSGEKVGIADQFYILPEHRGKGAGKVLVQACLAMVEFFGVKSSRVPSTMDMVQYYKKILPADFRIDTVIFTKE